MSWTFSRPSDLSSTLLSRLQLLNSNPTPMSGHVMDILETFRLVLHPHVRTHLAHTVKVRTLFDRNCRRFDIANQHGGLEYLHLFGCADGAVDLATCDQRTHGNGALNDRMVPHNEGAAGANFTFEATIDSNRPVEVDDAFEIDAFPQKREVLIVSRVVFLLIVWPPHNILLSYMLQCATVGKVGWPTVHTFARR